MKVRFLGTGEAFDGERNNTSLLIDQDLLLDCGYTACHALVPGNRFLKVDTIWISHFHGDHFAGTSALLLDLLFAQRKAPLELMGPPGLREMIEANLHLHYGKVSDEIDYPVTYTEVKPGDTLVRGERTFSFFETRHAAPSMAIKIRAGEKTLVYTADTVAFPELCDFCADADLVVHECYLVTGEHKRHASAEQLAAMMSALSTRPRLAVVHCWRDLDRAEIRAALQAGYDGEVLVPDDGDTCTL